MKMVLTDLETGKEAVMESNNMPKTHTHSEEFVRCIREFAIERAVGRIYAFAFPDIFTCGVLKTHNEMFILSPHVDMVRENVINE